jgi:hypothetical protein
MCLTSNAELLLTPIILAVATFTCMIYSSKTLAIVSGIVKVASKKKLIYISLLFISTFLSFFSLYIWLFFAQHVPTVYVEHTQLRRLIIPP